MNGRVSARRQRRMADYGFRVGMHMMSIAVDDARLPQVLKATFTQSLVISRGQIAAKLVYGDLQDQFGFGSGGFRLAACGKQGDQQQQAEPGCKLTSRLHQDWYLCIVI